MEEIRKIVNRINLKGFEGYDLSSMSFFLSEGNRLNKMIYWRPMLLYYFKCFYDRYDWKYEHGSTPILFFAIKTRDQHLEMFNSLSNIVDKRKMLSFRKKFTFSFSKGVFILKLLKKWLSVLKETNLSKEQTKCLVNELIRIKKLDIFTDRYSSEIGKINLLVLFYDAHGDSNFLIQKYKKLGVKSATISHGIVLAERDRELIDYSGVELRGSTSDYFLAWNNFTKREAIKQGFDLKKLLVLGIPQFINYIPKNSLSLNNKVFGLVLDNKSGGKFNEELVKIADSLSEKIDCKFTIRYHPTFKGNEYDFLIKNKNNYLGPNLSASVLEYAKTVEFTLIINSSVFIELVYLNHLVYRFKLNDLYDKYKDINVNSFNSEKELLEVITSGVNDTELLFKDLCSVKNVRTSYEDFFNRFIES